MNLRDITGTFFYFYTRKTLWDLHTNEFVPKLPDHAPKSIQDLIFSCLVHDKLKRPDASEIYFEALKNLDDADSALASIGPFHTILSPKPQNYASPSEPGSEQNTNSNLSGIKVQRMTDLEGHAVASQAQRQTGENIIPIPMRQSMDSFYFSKQDSPVPHAASSPQSVAHVVSPPTTKVSEPETQNPNKQALVRASSPMRSTRSSMSTTTRSIGDGSMSEIERWIGCLVVDYQRFPPVDKFISFADKNIMDKNLGTDIQFVYTDASSIPRKQSRFGFSLGPTPRDRVSTETKVEVKIAADECVEFILDESESYIEYLLLQEEPREWYERHKELKKRVYVTVGYIVYSNARIQESTAGSSRGFSTTSNRSLFASAGAPVGVEVGAISSGSMGSNSFGKTTASTFSPA